MNRALSYWVPAIFVFDLPDTISRFGFSQALENVLIAAAIIVFMEHVLFSYRIDLSDESLQYSQGLLRKTIELEKENIVCGRFLKLSPLVNLMSARLLLSMKDGRSHILSLASFRSSDIAEIIRWLPIEVKRKA